MLVPVPSDLVHASAALRRFRARLEEEELTGTIRFGRAVRPEESSGRTRTLVRDRWREPIDLRIPAPLDGRPRSATGATSYHFAGTWLSKDARSAMPDRRAAAGKRGASGSAPDPAVRFERYVSDEPRRDDRAAAFDRYLEAPKVPEQERGASVHGPSRAVLVRSNISDVAREREAFWQQAWAAERSPGMQRVELFHQRGTVDDWQAIASNPTMPEAVASVASQIVAERLAAAMQVQEERKRRPRQRSVIKLEDEASIEWAIALGERYGATRRDRLIHYPRLRGGRTQAQFAAELPAECDAADAAAIVAGLAGDLDVIGVRYTIVVHAPDASNDCRNLHLHMIWYPGRCTQEQDGRWRFGPAHGQPAKLRPGEIALLLGAVSAEERARLHHLQAAKADMKTLRARHAVHVNARLATRGRQRRYDPRTYLEMGIDKTPEKHLGTAAARLVAAGVHVAVDRENAFSSWSASHRRREREQSTRAYEHGNLIQRIQASLDHDSLPSSGSDAVLLRLRDRCRALSDEVLDGRAALDRIDLERAEAESAARRLLAGTAQIIAAIETGQARRDDLRNERFVRARHQMAARHLSEIAEALEPWTDEVERYRQRVIRAEHDLHDAQAQAIDEIAKRRAGAVWRAGSVLPLARYPDPLSGPRHLDALLDYMSSSAQEEAARSGWPLVHLVQQGGKTVVTGAGPLDMAVLRDPRHAARVDAALASMAAHQQRSVQRPIAYMGRYGIAALIEARRPGEGREIVAVANSYRRFRDHPTFVAALRAHEARLAASERNAAKRAAITMQSGGAGADRPSHRTSRVGAVQDSPVSEVANVAAPATVASGRIKVPSLLSATPVAATVLSTAPPPESSIAPVKPMSPGDDDRQTAGAPLHGDRPTEWLPVAAQVPNPPGEGKQAVGPASSTTALQQSRPVAVAESVRSLAGARANSATEQTDADAAAQPVDTGAPRPNLVPEAPVSGATAILGAPLDNPILPDHVVQHSLKPFSRSSLLALAARIRSKDESGPTSLTAVGLLAAAGALRGVPALSSARSRNAILRADHALGAGRHGNADTSRRGHDRTTAGGVTGEVIIDATESQPPHPSVADIQSVSADLCALSFLPLRRVIIDDETGRGRCFVLVVDQAVPDDVEVLRRAAMLDAEQLQRLYAERWMTMREQLRTTLTTGRSKALPQAVLKGLGTGDPHIAKILTAAGWDARLFAALRAAGSDPDIRRVIADSVGYWRKQARERLSPSRKARPDDPGRIEARRRAAEEQGDVGSLEALAALSKHSSKGR
ncbi:MobA/MobL family protein [Sphingomonas carotinifaciens]|uniref:MobA/MobL family protein n=1 Tax=Sphingomonas carotinifaciens TaxID=1166323 RepID=A0A1G7RT48_9SPHN|nr:MobA/MobL family protein [Sphingomonas carotinifaciens]MBB4088129.1 hypothetical protein [Sphingomonas carotinifaciens]MWC43819.1 hypothetical protein [Sphingomonas carotinifaciens]SDG13951.1 MobA/MobL family protein [Sphingomonas carotinifaciens]